MPLFSASCPDHNLVATVNTDLSRATLNIHADKVDGPAIRTANLDHSFASTLKSLRWFRSPRSRSIWYSEASRRVLLANDTTVHVFDADNQSYHAVISNAPAPTSRIAHLAFVSPDEVLVYADFGLKVTLWDLRTGVGLEIRDPKIIIRPGSGYDIRHKTGHLAVLAKQGAKDVVLVFSPAKRELEATWTVDTVDARGLRWSLDGLWVAIWDSSAMGPSIFIYTADGQLFRRWNGTQQHGDEDVGVGVERCEWDENGGLWVALGDERVLNLGGKTLTPHAIIHQPTQITSLPADASLFQESIAPQGSPGSSHSYEVASLPSVPPAGPTNTNSSPTIHLNPSPSRTYVAIVSPLTPTTVTIISIKPSPLIHTVLIHHNSIKSLDWHPHVPDLLLIQCTPPSSSDFISKVKLDSPRPFSPQVYIWGVELAAPRIIPFPAAPPTAATRVTGGIQPVASASWIGPSRSGIQTASTADPLLLFSNSKTASTISVYDPTAPIPDGSEQITNKTALAGGPIKSLLPAPAITGLGPEDAFDEGYSMDLSPVRTGELTGVGRLSTHFEDSGEAEDDTFGFKKGVPAVGKAKQQEGMSILDDSEFF